MNPFARIALTAMAAVLLASPALARRHPVQAEITCSRIGCSDWAAYRQNQNWNRPYETAGTPSHRARAVAHRRASHKAAPEVAHARKGYAVASLAPMPVPRPKATAKVDAADQPIVVDEIPKLGGIRPPPMSLADGAMILAVADAREYLVRTAHPGYTMSRQGAAKAVGHLHPIFALRLAAAIKQARADGLPDVGCYSTYRPPAFGVGGFSNKFDSTHAYGIASDMKGIGSPGSAKSKLWHKIALAHGLFNPYFGRKASEFNHYQAANVKIVRGALRKTITAHGPKDDSIMWRVANAIVPALMAVEIGSIEVAAGGMMP